MREGLRDVISCDVIDVGDRWLKVEVRIGE